MGHSGLQIYPMLATDPALTSQLVSVAYHNSRQASIISQLVCFKMTALHRDSPLAELHKRLHLRNACANLDALDASRCLCLLRRRYYPYHGYYVSYPCSHFMQKSDTPRAVIALFYKAIFSWLGRSQMTRRHCAWKPTLQTRMLVMCPEST